MLKLAECFGGSWLPILLKRVYEDPKVSDGKRVLVDRLWPRGVRKDKAMIDEWLKDLSPSNQLRKWFNHDPDKWDEFKKRYWKELESNKQLVLRLAKEAKKSKITFVFGSKEKEFNNAVALKKYVENYIEPKTKS